LKKIAVLVGVAAVVAWWRFRPFRVEIEGDSMEPALQDGDWCVAVVVRPGEVRKGDVVVLEHPERPGFELVKRVHGAGDGEVYVVGDNVESSNDSRDFGPVAALAVRGRVIATYWRSSTRRLGSFLPRT
jgi:nickel-type superoxide dismutase maturation protease